MTEEDQIEEKEKDHKKKKPKKKGSSDSSVRPLTPEELEEVRKTESELEINKPKFICIVHKGPIDGEIYLCPHCHTFYCEKCAKALKLQNEKCWACDNRITISIVKMEGLSASFDDMITIIDDDLTIELSEKTQKKMQGLKSKIIKAEKSLTKGEFKEATKKYEEAIILAVQSGKDQLASTLTAKATQIRKLIPEKPQKTKEEKHKEEFDKKIFKATKHLTKMIVKGDTKKEEESLESKVLKASVNLTKKLQKKKD
jgi:hypothetical protein